jgi:hypothetical protein
MPHKINGGREASTRIKAAESGLLIGVKRWVGELSTDVSQLESLLVTLPGLPNPCFAELCRKWDVFRETWWAARGERRVCERTKVHRFREW